LRCPFSSDALRLKSRPDFHNRYPAKWRDSFWQCPNLNPALNPNPGWIDYDYDYESGLGHCPAFGSGHALEGNDLIWWQRCCGTAVRRGSDAPTNFKMIRCPPETKLVIKHALFNNQAHFLGRQLTRPWR
jgi:hypothetical protein